MSWRELQVQIPNGRVRVQSRGEGPLFVWTHGISFPIEVDDLTPFPSVLARLTGVRVVRYDTRGHGGTPPAANDEAHRWARLGDELVELARALGAETFVAGGISMGAAISLHAAVRHPRAVRALALLAPPTGWETRPPQWEEYRTLAALGSPAKIAARIERQLVTNGAELPPPLRAMVEGIRRSDPVALGRILRGAAQSDLPPRADVAKVEVPVVVMGWENDSGHPITTARAIAAALPHADFRVVKGIDDEAAILAGLQHAIRSAR
jgi:3-oxoadipate enol-lactonase